MKQQYLTPEIKAEVLIKTDVLASSDEKDNRYVQSKSIFKDGFSLEQMDIL